MAKSRPFSRLIAVNSAYSVRWCRSGWCWCLLALPLRLHSEEHNAHNKPWVRLLSEGDSMSRHTPPECMHANNGASFVALFSELRAAPSDALPQFEQKCYICVVGQPARCFTHSLLQAQSPPNQCSLRSKLSSPTTKNRRYCHCGKRRAVARPHNSDEISNWMLSPLQNKDTTPQWNTAKLWWNSRPSQMCRTKMCKNSQLPPPSWLRLLVFNNISGKKWVFLTKCGLCPPRINSNWTYRSTPKCLNDLKSARIRFWCACVRARVYACIGPMYDVTSSRYSHVVESGCVQWRRHGAFNERNGCVQWTDECMEALRQLQNQRHTMFGANCLAIIRWSRDAEKRKIGIWTTKPLFYDMGKRE